MFVGYAENSKAYRLLDLDSNVIVESRDVEFMETKFLRDSIINPQMDDFVSLPIILDNSMNSNQQPPKK